MVKLGKRVTKIAIAIITAAVVIAVAAFLIMTPPVTKPPTPPPVEKKPYMIGVGGYRTGPFGRTGAPICYGVHDAARLINLKGGIDGWPMQVLEIETGYETPRIIEAYERTKAQGAIIFIPFSTGGTYAVTPRGLKDKIVILHTAYGISAAVDGETFPWNFLGTPTYWNIEATSIAWINKQEPLKGKKIGLLHLDIDYGRETLPVLKKLAEIYGYELLLYPLPWPGLEQAATWGKIMVEKPDWMIWRLWGESTVVALKEALRVGYPIKRIIGCPWSPTESDILATGMPEKFKGIKQNSFVAAGIEIPFIKEIREKLYAVGKGEAPDIKVVNTLLYNRGVYNTVLSAAAIRKAAEKFGHPVNSEQVKWGFEHLTIDDLKAIAEGIEKIVPPIRLTPKDHGGTTVSMMHEWDGEKFIPISPWLSAHEDVVTKLVKDAAEAFRKAHPELYK